MNYTMPLGLHHLIGIPWVERRDLSALSTSGLLDAMLDNLRLYMTHYRGLKCSSLFVLSDTSSR